MKRRNYNTDLEYDKQSRNECETMKGLRASAKGPLLLILLSIALLLPECVLSAPKVGRSKDDIIGHEGNPIKHSFSEVNEVETVDESWYPAVEVSNDYYDQKDEEKESKENANIFGETAKHQGVKDVSTASPAATTSATPQESHGNYTTFCEEISGGSCPPEDDDYEDEDLEDVKSTQKPETKLTNATSQVNSSSSDDSLEIPSQEGNDEGESAKSELVRDLETELDCLIEDVEMILEHTKQFVKDSSSSHDEEIESKESLDDIGLEDLNKKTLKHKDLKKVAVSDKSKTLVSKSEDSTDVDSDAIEDEDLIESMDTDIHVQVHSDRKINPEHKSAAEDSSSLVIKDEDLQDTLNPKKLEDIIKKEHNDSHSHKGSHKDHHVKEHKK